MQSFFPFTYADKEYAASISTWKQTTVTEFHVSIDDEQLKNEFGQTHIFSAPDDGGNWSFGFPGSPFGSGHEFVTCLGKGLIKFLNEAPVK